jgi:hypothetical protein
LFFLSFLCFSAEDGEYNHKKNRKHGTGQLVDCQRAIDAHFVIDALLSKGST